MFRKVLPQFILGLSDFHFFSIFQNGHIAIDWLVQFQKIGAFSKNHRDLENKYFIFICRNIHLASKNKHFFIFQKWRRRFFTSNIVKKKILQVFLLFS